MDDDGIKKTDHYLSLEYLWEEVVKKGGAACLSYAALCIVITIVLEPPEWVVILMVVGSGVVYSAFIKEKLYCSRDRERWIKEKRAEKLDSDE
ncbi:hypothetical protein CU102_22155 [Phyllobacterium brassicacearum]|uniref:Uncharacterized protein n=1 Tax=Phyllobacterium brassicacearum TaxID=314235 RepID=A0A2P7BD41_9HYPH|nr:hypothetical protein [Phyllobacterium brassicacearum]PSH64387.1 hypothetical protein CU102_22155 [Phyllobacterium brassicacearum]TDQ21315.1 hypothetical protein DEV91_120102 [Phyllobacterium brassicacearum]